MYKHAGFEDISEAEIERRFQAALLVIYERSRKRRMEVESIRLGRGDAA